MAKFLQDGVADKGLASIKATLKEKLQQGAVELSNALYNANGQLTVPPVISQAQIQQEQKHEELER